MNERSPQSTADQAVAVRLTLRDWFVATAIMTSLFGGNLWMVSTWKVSLERDIGDSKQLGERNEKQIRDLIDSQDHMRDVLQNTVTNIASDVGQIKGQLLSLNRELPSRRGSD
jgi:hypothetical protein